METLVAVLNIVLIVGFCWWFWKRQEQPLRKFYWHALAAKLSAGTLLGIIYAATFTTSDTFFLFDWSTELSHEARQDFSWYLNYMWNGQPAGYFPGVGRTIFFVKFTSILALLTYDNYWISALYFSLLSFLAGWKLTKLIWQHIPSMGVPAVIALLFFPSCVFWTSGIMKESVAMIGLFFLSSIVLRIWWKQKVSVLDWVVGAISIWVVWSIKYYYVGLFLSVAFALLVTKEIIERKKIGRFSSETLILISVFVITIILGSFTHPNFSLSKIPEVLVSNNQLSMAASAPGNVIQYTELENSWVSVARNSPWALVSGLFRPFVWETDSLLKLFAAAENLILLILGVMSLWSIRKMKDSPYRLLIVAILIYCAVLCIFLAISAPNFGTLVRYRIGFLPFLLLILLNRPPLVRALSKLFNVHTDNLSR